MTLLRRLMFAIKYDIDPGFIVYSIPDQTAVRFLYYKTAKEFSVSDSQLQYKPKVMVAVKEQKGTTE